MGNSPGFIGSHTIDSAIIETSTATKYASLRLFVADVRKVTVNSLGFLSDFPLYEPRLKNFHASQVYFPMPGTIRAGECL
jgi:hypothetical protein